MFDGPFLSLVFSLALLPVFEIKQEGREKSGSGKRARDGTTNALDLSPSLLPLPSPSIYMPNSLKGRGYNIAQSDR